MKQLTPRKREVVLLLQMGRSYVRVGAELRISVRTVMFHVKQIAETCGPSTDAPLRVVLAHAVELLTEECP